MQRTEEVLPFIYTPTVGEACQRYHELPLKPYGVYISLEDRGKVAQRLQSLGGWVVLPGVGRAYSPEKRVSPAVWIPLGLILALIPLSHSPLMSTPLPLMHPHQGGAMSA